MLHFASTIHNIAFTKVLGYVELCSGTGDNTFQKKQYPELCKVGAVISGRYLSGREITESCNKQKYTNYGTESYINYSKQNPPQKREVH